MYYIDRFLMKIIKKESESELREKKIELETAQAYILKLSAERTTLKKQVDSQNYTFSKKRGNNNTNFCVFR